jgi:hypothetical protein
MRKTILLLSSVSFIFNAWIFYIVITPVVTLTKFQGDALAYMALISTFTTTYFLAQNNNKE